MERIVTLENKIVSDYVKSIIKIVNHGLLSTNFDFPQELKTRLMNTICRKISVTGDGDMMRLYVSSLELEKEIAEIVKEYAIELFISKLDKQNE